jgi:sulfatase maturation enzyme AslB (radical SAM superfamily)
VQRLTAILERGCLKNHDSLFILSKRDLKMKTDTSSFIKRTPADFTTLSLVPNQKCNFNCSYCYSAEGRSAKVIDRAVLHKGLDFFIDRQRIAPQTLKMFVSGGGEPFVTQDITCHALEYAHERAKQQGFQLWASVVTNGSIVNDKIINVLKRHGTSVCVSFEILEDLQEQLRCHYRTVAETLARYGNAGVPTMVNSTITPLSVNRMDEMTEMLFRQYPFVRSFTMEPVTDYRLFPTPAHLADFYGRFMQNYFKIKQRYGKSDLEIWCSLELMTAAAPRRRYCPGKLCLTPEGTFTICHCATSSKEERYERCVYGKIDGNGVSFDLEKFHGLLNINASTMRRCDNCIAKMNCGGECLTRIDLYPTEYMDEVCNFNRRWLEYHNKRQSV